MRSLSSCYGRTPRVAEAQPPAKWTPCSSGRWHGHRSAHRQLWFPQGPSLWREDCDSYFADEETGSLWSWPEVAKGRTGSHFHASDSERSSSRHPSSTPTHSRPVPGALLHPRALFSGLSSGGAAVPEPQAVVSGDALRCSVSLCPGSPSPSGLQVPVGT